MARVAVRRRVDGSRRVTVARGVCAGGGGGGRRVVRAAGLRTRRDRVRVFDKFMDLGVDLPRLAAGDVTLVELTVSNSNLSPEGWLRGGVIVDRVWGVLRRVYGGGPLWSRVGCWWVEEFGRGNKPHVHMAVVLPSVRWFKPRWGGVVFDDLGVFLERVGLRVIERSQVVGRGAAGYVSRGRVVVARGVRGFVDRIRSINLYFSKLGVFDYKAGCKVQSLGADRVWDNSCGMSGYRGLRRVERVVFDVVGGVGDRLLSAVAVCGWGLRAGGVPCKGANGGGLLLGAGAVLGRGAWFGLLDRCGAAGGVWRRVPQPG